MTFWKQSLVPDLAWASPQSSDSLSSSPDNSPPQLLACWAASQEHFSPVYSTRVWEPAYFQREPGAWLVAAADRNPNCRRSGCLSPCTGVRAAASGQASSG